MPSSGDRHRDISIPAVSCLHGVWELAFWSQLRTIRGMWNFATPFTFYGRLARAGSSPA